ncbi:hypothetical protein [Spectribacter hydrogenoxidans]|uniref:Uncharacterized protein n=1 Tax=Spectribacter hydrogenoxidans TaxID=3075608 RepID=A0ABU3C0G3_9GAMM|nr:hypothetical protein [Salinisphaera sp. W335]MDT0635053.1 hypothetical protein [Salinisphaera sp. W335]
MSEQELSDTNLAGSDDKYDVLHLRYERIGVLVDHLVHLVITRGGPDAEIEKTVLFLNQEVHDTDGELERLRYRALQTPVSCRPEPRPVRGFFAPTGSAAGLAAGMAAWSRLPTLYCTYAAFRKEKRG